MSSSSAARTDEIEQLARSRFGITYLYPIQRFVVSNVLEGNPQIVILPTGAGKSLCFQLPSLLLPGPTLVLMPLLSLISDQERKLRALGFPVVLLKGGLSREDKDGLWSGLHAGRTRLVLATPEEMVISPFIAGATVQANSWKRFGAGLSGIGHPASRTTEQHHSDRKRDKSFYFCFPFLMFDLNSTLLSHDQYFLSILFEPSYDPYSTSLLQMFSADFSKSVESDDVEDAHFLYRLFFLLVASVAFDFEAANCCSRVRI